MIPITTSKDLAVLHSNSKSQFFFSFFFLFSFLFLIISEKEWIIHLAIAKEHQTKLSEETLNRINFDIKMKTMSAGLNEHMGTYQY
jgi:hypothetical protein